MDKSKFEGLIEFVNELETQDNRITQTPILITLQKKEKVYTGSDVDYSESGKASDELGEDCKDRYGVSPDEIVYWKNHWVDVAWFFTYKGYEEHVRLNGHNYRTFETHTYVYSLGYRNPEAVKMFGWLKEMAKELKNETTS